MSEPHGKNEFGHKLLHFQPVRECWIQRIVKFQGEKDDFFDRNGDLASYIYNVKEKFYLFRFVG